MNQESNTSSRGKKKKKKPKTIKRFFIPRMSTHHKKKNIRKILLIQRQGVSSQNPALNSNELLQENKNKAKLYDICSFILLSTSNYFSTGDFLSLCCMPTSPKVISSKLLIQSWTHTNVLHLQHSLARVLEEVNSREA